MQAKAKHTNRRRIKEPMQNASQGQAQKINM
jgi:hypothetical protein